MNFVNVVRYILIMLGEVVCAWLFFSFNKMIIFLLLLNDWCGLILVKKYLISNVRKLSIFINIIRV